MFYKVYLRGGGNIVASGLKVLPNGCGGVRSLRFTEVVSCWTGSTHLWIDGAITIQISDLLTTVYSRSSLDEDNEPWHSLVEVTPPREFEYKFWGDIANELESQLASPQDQ